RGVSSGPGVGQGAAAIGRGEVPQVDGLPGQPCESSGADEQPCRADQPDVPAVGKGAIQVAATADAGALRRPDAGQHLEGTNSCPAGSDRSVKSCRNRKDGRRDEETRSGRLKTRWCSARSLKKTARAPSAFARGRGRTTTGPGRAERRVA